MSRNWRLGLVAVAVVVVVWIVLAVAGVEGHPDCEAHVPHRDESLEILRHEEAPVLHLAAGQACFR